MAEKMFMRVNEVAEALDVSEPNIAPFVGGLIGENCSLRIRSCANRIIYSN